MLASTRRSTRVGWYTVAAAVLVVLGAAPSAFATDTVCDGTAVDGAGYVCTTAGSWTIPDPATAITWGSKGCDAAYPSGDECSVSRTLAQGFRWYGTTYTSVNIGSNGYVSFNGSARTTAGDVSIPDLSAPSAAIYAYGDDLWDDGSASVQVGNAETCDVGAGNQTCAVVRWNNLAVLDIDGIETGRVTVKLALVYATGRAYVQVVGETDTDPQAAHPRAVGTENADSSVGLWFKGAGDGESGDANAGSQFVFGPESDPPAATVGSELPLDDATGVALNATVRVTFDEPMTTSSVALSVLSGTDPGGWTPSWSNGNRTVTFTHNALSHTTTYALQVTANDVAGNAVEVNNRTAVGGCTGYCWNFSTVDLTPPSNLAKQTNTSTDLEATMEYIPPVTDCAGVLVLRSGSAVTDAPVAGQTYSVGDLIGNSEVVCVAGAVATACTDPTVSANQTYYYKSFAFDSAHNYASGVAITAAPKGSSVARWAANVNVASLGPAGVEGDALGTSAIIEIGNDRLFHRFSEDGLRNGWNSPAVAGTVQGRPAVGDLGPDGGPADTRAYVATQAGFLYRFSTSAVGAPESQNPLVDAGCATGSLQAGPVLSLDKYDGNGNADDDRVVQATRCTGASAAGNKVLLYSLDLSTEHGSWPSGGGYSLGPVNSTPVVWYRDGGNNQVLVTARTGGTHTVAALEIGAGGAFPQVPWGVLTEAEAGEYDAAPILIRRGTDTFGVIGNTLGEIRVLNLPAGSGNGGPITVQATYVPGSDFDGAIKGLGATAYLGTDNWIVWSTDTQVHGIKYTPTGFDPESYWEQDLSSPSIPLVLTGFLTAPRHRAFVGAGDGRLYVLNVETGAVYLNPLVQSGATLGEPSFDYNDGASQGMVVGSSTGVLYWVPLTNEAP